MPKTGTPFSTKFLSKYPSLLANSVAKLAEPSRRIVMSSSALQRGMLNEHIGEGRVIRIVSAEENVGVPFRGFAPDCSWYQILSSLDRCFKLIGEKPVALSGRIHDVFIEDFRRELAEIQAPAAKALFVLVKANQLMHLRIAEYVALIAMADVTGHFGVGVLLESCLADKLAFVERTRRLIRQTIESKHALKLAA